MKRNHIYNTVLGLAVAALTLTACSDEWDNHYNSLGEAGVSGTTGSGSLWEAIQANPELSNFASVVQACGYDKSLGGNQVFTVFAPTNSSFSSEEAQRLIQAYNAEKGTVDDDEITTVKEFLQNHIALYNHSVSSASNDSIVLMNGKYAVLTADAIDGNKFLTSNQHYGNGVLFTLEKKVEFFSNLFEYLRKDADLDSIRSFFYNKMFYRQEFLPERSVAGGIVDGKTVYLDSVFRQQNDLFGLNFLDAEINTEDSTYLMVVPTNKVWRELVEEYSNYFNYEDSVEYRDSLVYTNTRMGILKGTVFSRTFNSDAVLRDSAMSTNCVMNANYRRSYWGADSLHYYQYYKPLSTPDGVLTGATNIACSNGTIYKSDDWKFNKLETFYRLRIIEAEYGGNIREVSKVNNTTTKEDEETISPRLRYVTSDNKFYNKVSNNGFVEFEPLKNTVNHSVIFNIPEVLSNIGYDIYLVTAPALANDSNATHTDRLPTNLRCTIYYHDQNGKEISQELVSSVTTNPDIVDAIPLAKDFKFPVCSFGLQEERPQASLKVETRVSSSQLRNNTLTRTMRIDCILLKPHEE